MKASCILHELQANKKVYGSNSALTGATPANVDLALQYIDRSVALFPENAVYLNLKALLLWEGKGDKESATALLENAAALNPRDIDIQNNLNAIKTSQCVVATAAFGSPFWRGYKGGLGVPVLYAVLSFTPRQRGSPRNDGCIALLEV